MNNKVRQLREVFGMTQDDLAEKVHVSRMTIFNIEKRKHIPSLQLAFRIARLFNRPIEKVFIFEGREGVLKKC